MIRNFNPLIRQALSMGRRFELVAIAREVVRLRSGSSLSEATALPARSATIVEPWASGVAIIERGDPVTRVVALDRGCLVAFGVDGDRRIERLALGPTDAELVAALWAICDVSSTPDVHEMRQCLLLSAALHAGMLPDVAVSRWSDGDIAGLASELDLPDGTCVRQLYAAAHAADIATQHPGGDATEHDALRALQAVVPPRWVLAVELRHSGREDLFEMVMEAHRPI